MIESINESLFDATVLDNKGLVVVDFNADWCGPCQILGPVLAALAEEHPAIKFVSVNVDENEQLAEKYQVLSIPCVVFFKNGQEVKRNTGFLPKTVINNILQELQA